MIRGLYAIADVEALEARGLELEPFCEAVLSGRPGALQLRDKRGAPRETLARLRALAPLARRAGVPLFANDRPDLAALAGADGVHLGQTDLPAGEVAERWSGLAVGLSTHDDAQLEEALALARLAYVAVGPVFETRNKTGSEGPAPEVGLDALARRARRAAERRPQMPVVAIGGLDLPRARLAAVALGPTGAWAVIGALVPPKGPDGGDPYAWVAEASAALSAAGSAA